MNDKLLKIQQELKAPKGQYNSFGNYKYRSAEDILEGVKPLLAKHKAVLTLSDEAVAVGDRVYIKATATLAEADIKDSDKANLTSYDNISVSAYAREAESKKGMDTSQITGSTSSYARKYALNGLFAIDDTKDADTDEQRKQADKPAGLDESKAEVFAEFKKQGIENSGDMMNAIDKAINKASIRSVDDANKVLAYLRGEQ